jgi:hypothetical protein
MGFEGYQYWGRIVQLKAPRTFMIDIGVNNTAGCTWDASNDWSYTGLAAAPASGDPPRTPHIPVYSSGLRAFGEEPPTCFDAPTPLACPR